MGTFHRATITPTKAELIAEWAPTQSWGPATAAAIDVIGAYRFDDPDNRVGMETHLVMAEGRLLHIPLTYRDEPVGGADDVGGDTDNGLITEMHHSELGTRWVYDGLKDDRYLIMLAAVTMSGQGEALGMVQHDGRWHLAPTPVRIQGGGWTLERAAVDRFQRVSGDDPNSETAVVFTNDRFELSFFRQPVVRQRPAIGLTATWDEQPDPVVLAEVREL